MAAIEARFMQEEIEAAAYSFAKSVDDGEKVVVGVNRFTDAEAEPTEVFPIDIKLQQIQIDRTRSVRAERDQAAVDRALADVAETARGEGNLLVPMKAALKQMATLGEVSDVLRARVRRLPARGLSRGGEGPTRFWPLFDLVVRTPRLELRLPREEEFAALIELVDGGIHEPGDDALLRSVDRRRAGAARPGGCPVVVAAPGQLVTGQLDLHRCGVFVDGPPVGVQDLGAEHFRAVRSVETGSWLGRAHQGQGLGREMREAILHLAFAGLGAEEALSGAFEDNAASMATSRSVGYEENGEARGQRRDGSGRTIRFRMDRDAWEGAVAPTSRSSGSRAASTCSSARPADRLEPLLRLRRGVPPFTCVCGARPQRGLESIGDLALPVPLPAEVDAGPTLLPRRLRRCPRVSSRNTTAVPEAHDAETALRPVVEVRLLLLGSDVAGEGGAADRQERGEVFLEEPGSPRLQVRDQAQRDSLFGPVAVAASKTTWAPPRSPPRTSTARLAPLPCPNPARRAPPPGRIRRADVPVTTSAQAVAKSASSSRLASTPKRSLKAACQGPRPPRRDRGPPRRRREPRTLERVDPPGSPAVTTRAPWAEPVREFAEKPIRPALPHRAPPERIVGLQVFDRTGDDLTEHLGGLLRPLERHQLRGNGPFLVQDDPRSPPWRSRPSSASVNRPRARSWLPRCRCVWARSIRAMYVSMLSGPNDLCVDSTTRNLRGNSSP